ncbi:hypothetical protein F5Y07DRAFT_355799 [Xylaria sp. FL0933]|nr:hypothetical protein F5Y07DRAFT_355799 [Xylaria sp. FL0933]
MHSTVACLLAASLGLASAIPSPWNVVSGLQSRRGVPHFEATKLYKRGEPETGDDLPDVEPHPNQLDKVETAFKDAIELSSYVLSFIDTDNDVLPHYFDPNDRAEIKRIFSTINNGDNGNDMLGDILVQTTDANNLCGGSTLSYLKNGEKDATETPYIVLCPNAFKKKAVTALNGKGPHDSDALDYYAGCGQDGGEIDQNVSYLMNTLGMTLLHEYMHYDKMIASSFGSITDNPNGQPGYGPVNVYDKLDKSLARINADSYAYYASQVLWTTLCGHEFQAPRPGIDDADPDCGGVACSA